ncbi:flavin reductase [Burkholderia sp. WAC0059]|uniref:flavin reductase family protein n=1 Tax=Burkholderia sp. WAC0059 TaxID=2066022 RepID=UPI000C7ED637|nr:flavin reductase family protein [Burkholderia sp. WAC0059]PLZ03172.1 flavin reductase [Burkholderia sp. WAC0059]
MNACAPTAAVQPALFQEAMSRFAGTVTIVSTEVDGRRYGMVATSVCSVSAEPPTLLVCINKSASTHDPIVAARHFAVNALSTRHAELVRRFSTMAGEARFEPGRWNPLTTGAPVLVDAGIALDCRLIAAHDGFSHTIFVGQVAEAIVSDEPPPDALLWHRRGLANCSPLF